QFRIKRIAIAGDVWYQLGKGGGRVVRVGPGAADAGGHEQGAGQCRRRLEQGIFARQAAPPHPANAAGQGSKTDLPDDVAAETSLVVDVVRVPFAEEVVRPLVGRMAVVVGARVEGEFVQNGWIETRRREQVPRGGVQDRKGARHQVGIAAGSDAG